MPATNNLRPNMSARVTRGFCRIACLLLPLVSYAQKPERFVPFTERTPAYFVDRYGMAKSAKNVTEHSFLHPTRGALRIKGAFSVREFRSDDLQVQAVFHATSLKLAEVRFQLPREWARDQVEAALKAYSSEWKPASGSPAVKVWTTPSGAKAINLINFLHIQSPAVTAAIDAALAEADAKRKAVPKF